MKFKESVLAHQLLDGLQGIEIGGSAHNPFGLNTVNVDRYPGTADTVFKRAEFDLCGEMLPVDVVAFGDNLPFEDKSYDFIVSSHVIEHFYDPIATLAEWARVARKYIYIICPHKERTTDQHKPITTTCELEARHQNPKAEYQDKHWNIWDTQSFVDFVTHLGYRVHTVQDIDDKVGNGFTVVIELTN